MRVEHDWILKRNPAKYGNSAWWTCTKCGSRVDVTAKQIEWNTFRRPNKKRKFDGMFCGELVVKGIHES